MQSYRAVPEPAMVRVQLRFIDPPRCPAMDQACCANPDDSLNATRGLIAGVLGSLPLWGLILLSLA